MSDEHDQNLLAQLRSGEQQVVSSYELARRLGINQRTVGFIVNRLRRNGHLIGSVHGEGYYLIETLDELQRTVAHIAKRKRGIDQTINALRAAWMEETA